MGAFKGGITRSFLVCASAMIQVRKGNNYESKVENLFTMLFCIPRKWNDGA